MSTDKMEEKKNNPDEGLKDNQTKDNSSIFGRLFGRRDKNIEIEAEKVAAEAPATQEGGLLRESPPAKMDERKQQSLVDLPVDQADTAGPATVTEPDSKDSAASELELSDEVLPTTNLNPDRDTVDRKQKGFFSRLKNGLAKTRKQFV
ncbi:MAG: hypothetical protein KAG92_04840, partial [Deltaproteobacteria bacterium]|nr:hypothetical protein [Deltaproteobacteria bacterium]